MEEIAPTVAGRSCKGCTMCCYLPPIPELQKPRQSWCTHCDKARGCTIYDSKPAYCTLYKCAYLTNPGLDDRWKPSASKIVMHGEDDQLIVLVDGNRPDAWRKEPFYSSIKRWAQDQDGFTGGVFVFEGSHCIFLHGAKEKVLGVVGPDQVIITRKRPTPAGIECDPIVTNKPA